MRAVRTPRYKYIRNFGDRPLVYLPLDVYHGRAGEEMRDEYYATRRPSEELYDLQRDPLETANRADDPAHSDIMEDLRGKVADWMERTGDRLLAGDWPPTTRQRLYQETDPSPN